MKVRLDVIDPNPERDFGINPIEPEQVKKLRASIRDLGFWNNIVVRKHPTAKGRYELAYGHTRLEAAKREGETEADIPVLDLDDDQMKHIMDAENATQRAYTSAAAADSVASAVRRLCVAIAEGHLAKIFARSSQKSNDTIQGQFLQRGEIGERLVYNYINRQHNPDAAPGDDDKDLFPHGDIRTHLSVLFKSGEIPKLYKAARKTVGPEAAARINAALAALEKRDLVIPQVDGALRSAFDNTHQLKTFVATVQEMEKATGLKVPVEKQRELAEKVKGVARAGAGSMGEKKATAAVIATRTREQFAKAIKSRNKAEDRERDASRVEAERFRIERGKAVSLMLDKNTLSYCWKALAFTGHTQDEVARMRGWWKDAQLVGASIERLGSPRQVIKSSGRLTA